MKKSKKIASSVFCVLFSILSWAVCSDLYSKEKILRPKLEFGKSVGYQDDWNIDYKHSDVFMSYFPAPPSLHKEYGATVWAWGIDSAWNDAQSEKVKEAYEDSDMSIVGTCISACILPPPHTKIGKETRQNKELLETYGINIEGKPILTPFWPTDYKDGTFGWWYCTNNPIYVESVKERVRDAMSTGANTFHMDVAHGTAMMLDTGAGGCFCDYCEDGFREHLSKKYSSKKLVELGIEDIDKFVYRERVKKVASTVAGLTKIYRNKPNEIPLLEDYQEYQSWAGASFIKEMTDLARKVADKPIITTGNAGGVGARYLAGLESYDNLVVEVPHFMLPGHVPMMPYKICDSMGKMLVSWPISHDIARIQKDNQLDLLKQWICFSYAQGGAMMVPHKLWAGTGAHAVNNLNVKEVEFSSFYQFVQKNADLFDDYETVEQVGILYSNRSVRKKPMSTVGAYYSFMEANVPFGFALAGDEFLSTKLDKEMVKSRFDKLFIPEPTMLDPKQQAIVDELIEEGVAVPLNMYTSARTIKSLASVNKNAWLFPRKIPESKSAPVVIHVLNKNFNKTTKKIVTQEKVDVTVSSKLIDNRLLKKAIVYSPSGEPYTAKFQKVSNGYKVTIPELKYWSILKLES